jgi:hypothetical protein
VEHNHANLRSSFARGERLAMSPNTEYRISLARVELGDDEDLHGSSHAAAGGMVELWRQAFTGVGV